jgi:predicted Zn-dependent protease with MMP-like domain
MPSPFDAASGRSFGLAPSLAEMEAMAARIFADLPAAFTAPCRDLVVRVEDFPDDDVLAEMGIESPFDLAGLYHGVPLTDRQITNPRPMPDMVYLYRRALLDWWCEEERDLEALIRHVLIHEIGHHFGFSDADMDRIEGTASDDH